MDLPTANSHAAVVDCLAASEDGVNTTDFAYIRATILFWTPPPGQKYGPFASKSDRAPSVHYKRSSDVSTRSSTADLIDLGEYGESSPFERRCESQRELYNDRSETEDEELLLLPALATLPQAMWSDGVVECFDAEQDLLIFPLLERN